MLTRMIMLIWLLIGGSVGYNFFPNVFKHLFPNLTMLHSPAAATALGVILGFVIGWVSLKKTEKAILKLQRKLAEMNVSYLLFGAAGAIVGLVLALLINFSLVAFSLPIISNILPTIVTVVLAYVGFEIGSSRREEIRRMLLSRREHEESGVLPPSRDDCENFRRFKVLDTSVIIDGRILDVIQTGFLEGTFLVSKYVLQELQHIADSSDSLKRVRGRRGLDILNALQKTESAHVKISDEDIPEAEEVDMKLVHLAKRLDGVVVTNDFNLNKVAEFQNVPVLNVNELANAVKPVVIPGEQMTVIIVKEGTEREQGVAYLDDGTMVVVEDGKFYMNERVDVIVTSSLQTNAGRMIFAKMASEGRITQ